MFVKSVVLSYRLNTAAPPNDLRGGARPTMIIIRLRLLDDASGVASLSTLLLHSRYLLQSLASLIASN
eukprot:5056107-Pleurochrysis_carterae.AAC.1